MSKTFTAVVTAHAESPRSILGNLMYQSRRPDQILVYLSDVPSAEVARLREEFNAVFTPVENRNDWGHEKRAMGVADATSDYLGFFNHDDEYDLTYIEKMLCAAEGMEADAIYCGWLGEHGNPRPAFGLGSSTSGNFIVKTELAREVGYESRAYEADGYFINAIADKAEWVGFVPEVLYTHH